MHVDRNPLTRRNADRRSGPPDRRREEDWRALTETERNDVESALRGDLVFGATRAEEFLRRWHPGVERG